MWMSIRTGAVTFGKAVGGAVVLGIGVTIGHAIAATTLEALSNSANKLANSKAVKRGEKKVAQATSDLAQHAS